MILELRTLEQRLEQRPRMPRRRGTKVRSERLTFEQLCHEHFQCRDLVDVVPRGQNMHGQTQFGGALLRLSRDVLRAPGDVLEQPAMSRLDPEQVVAAVKGWAEHRPLARLRKHLGGFEQERGGQRRAVGVDDDCRAMAAFEEMRNGMVEAFPQRWMGSL